MAMQPHSKKRVCYYYDSKYEIKKIILRAAGRLH